MESGSSSRNDSFWSIPWDGMPQNASTNNTSGSDPTRSLYSMDSSDPHDAAALSGASEAAARSLASLLYDEDILEETQGSGPPAQNQVATQHNGYIHYAQNGQAQHYMPHWSEGVSGYSHGVAESVHAAGDLPDVESQLTAKMASLSLQKGMQLAWNLFQVIVLETHGYGIMSFTMLKSLLSTKYSHLMNASDGMCYIVFE